jgi:hypothetical protein
MEAVAGQLVRRDVIPKLTGRGGLGQQVLDQVMDLPLRVREVRTSMQEGGKFGAGVLVGEAVVGDERVGLQHGLEPLASVAWLVAEFGELGKVGGDLAFVPGNQDRLDVWEVLVQRRPACASSRSPPISPARSAGLVRWLPTWRSASPR